jgi:hypothetical protein
MVARVPGRAAGAVAAARPATYLTRVSDHPFVSGDAGIGAVAGVGVLTQ